MTDQHTKIIKEGRKSVAGLMKQDKMRLIFFLLELQSLAHWILEASFRNSFLAALVPGFVLDKARALNDLFEETGVDPGNAYHNFGRFCHKRYYVCPSCGVFTDRQETTQNVAHDAGCHGLCSQEIHPTDFFTP